MLARNLANERRRAGLFDFFILRGSRWCLHRRWCWRLGAGTRWLGGRRCTRTTLCWCGLGWRGRFCRGWPGNCRLSIDCDRTDDRIYSYRCAFRHLNFLKHSRGRSRNLGIDLVGRNLKQGLVSLDFIARLFQPFGNSAFNDGFAHLRHDDVSWHDSLPCGPQCLSGRAQTTYYI